MGDRNAERREFHSLPWPSRWRGQWILAGFVIVYLGLAGGSASQKSVTVDEFGHLPSGLYFLQTGDARYAALNPPLLNALSAAPLLWMDLDPAPEPPPPDDDPISFWANGYHFQEMHREDYLRVFAVARWVPILGVALLAWLQFAWARRLAPEAPDLAGLLAAGFVCFSPNVIAHARLVGTDTGTALLVTCALWSLQQLLKKPGFASSLLCGAVLGLAQLTKFYALLLYPVFVAIACVWLAIPRTPQVRAGRLFGGLAFAIGISFVVLNTGYLWGEFGGSLDELSLQSPLLSTWQASPLGSVPLPLPGAYLRALDGQLFEVASSIPTFLFGESFEGGRWYFYPAILAIKSPLSLMLAVGLGLWLSLFGPRLPASEVVLLLAYPVVLFGVLSLGEGRQLGGRALLSAVPLVWIWVAVCVARSRPMRWPSALAAAALAVTLGSSLAAYPDYLSYFNPLVGGPKQGYRYASEANVDIGQDLALLAKYLDGQDESSVQLLYFGSVDPRLYGIDYEIATAPLKEGLFAVSVSLYHMGYPMYDRGALHNVGPVDVSGLGEPIAELGGSIHVYRVAP